MDDYFDYLSHRDTLVSLGMVLGEDRGVFEGEDAAVLAAMVGFPHYYPIGFTALTRSMKALLELSVEYRPWTFRLVRYISKEPYVVLFSHEDDAVHFRLLT